MRALITALYVILAAVPEPTASQDAIAIAKAAMVLLRPVVDSYLADLRRKRESDKIKIRMWMHNGDVKLNGCGFYFRADGYSGGSGSGFFPAEVDHRCADDETFNMRMTSQSAMYSGEVHLGNEQTRQVELHADGWHNTFVNVLCIGFDERTIAGGPRAFCVNNNILKACKKLMNKWSDVNTDFNDMMFTRTSRGTHKLVFRDIENLVNGFERLSRNNDDADAVWAVCDRMDLVKGDTSDDHWHCAARKRYTHNHLVLFLYSITNEYKAQDKNPYGCNRYTDRR
jgi:hypothetical protein